MENIDPRLKVTILRNIEVVRYPFVDYFKGFEEVEAVRQLFCERTEEVLKSLRVEFTSGRGYMGVSCEDGYSRKNKFKMEMNLFSKKAYWQLTI
jgi:hypothetical protein